MYAIWQMAQFFDTLDPLKGWAYGWSQAGAVLLAFVAYWLVGRKIKGVAKKKLGWGYLAVAVVALVFFLLLSVNIIIDIPSEDWFPGKIKTQLRFVGTLISYWAFATSLGVVIALIKHLGPRPRRETQQR